MHVHHESRASKTAIKTKIGEWQKKRDESARRKGPRQAEVALNHIHHFKHTAAGKAMV